MRQLKMVQCITDRTENSISRYLTDIAHIDLLRQDEEVNLAMRAQAGDHLALEILIKTNLRFVVSVAKQYQNKGMNLADLISEGNLGLIKAAHRFDYTKGFKFISFAVYWIRQFIIQAISDQKRIVRLPGNQIYNMNKVTKAMVKLEQELERTPALNEIAEMLELTEEKISEILSGGALTISVDARIHTHTEMSLIETLINKDSLGPIDQLFEESLFTDLIHMLNKLPERQRIILKYWYGLDKYPQLGHQEIARKLNLTSQRIRQLRATAFCTLGKLCKVNGMEDYFNIK